MTAVAFVGPMTPSPIARRGAGKLRDHFQEGPPPAALPECARSSFVVATGEVIADLGPTRISADFAAHLRHVAGHFPGISGCDWVVDNLNTHWSLDACRVMAELCGVPFVAAELATGRQRRAFLTGPTHEHVFHFTPTHGSWLNQVELWFSVFTRRFLNRGDFASMADFEARLLAFLEDDNRSHAHPYRWTYDGTPLVCGIPFSRTRREQRQGRAGFSPRPQRFHRDLYHRRRAGRRQGLRRERLKFLRRSAGVLPVPESTPLDAAQPLSSGTGGP